MKQPEKLDPFRALTPEEMEKLEPIPDEMIQAALEEGYKARQAYLESYVVPCIPSGLRFR
jgi:hypothetical protein